MKMVSAVSLWSCCQRKFSKSGIHLPIFTWIISVWLFFPCNLCQSKSRHHNYIIELISLMWKSMLMNFQCLTTTSLRTCCSGDLDYLIDWLCRSLLSSRVTESKYHCLTGETLHHWCPFQAVASCSRATIDPGRHNQTQLYHSQNRFRPRSWCWWQAGHAHQPLLLIPNPWCDPEMGL